MSSRIEHVSDTAFWIAHLRRLESERSDALFHDPFAARLAGDRGRQISEAMPTSGVVGWTVALRTRIIDEFLGFAINAGIDTVLSLGAGLDARPYRMTLPASLHWIEADYPHMIEYKEAQLQGEKPVCLVERVKIDLADREARKKLFTRVNEQALGILILTEGVVPYLDSDAVAALADDLRAMERVRFWVLDYFSPEAMKFRQRGRVGRAMRNAPFKFAPEDWSGFFKQHGWREKQMRYLADEAARVKRPFPMPFRYRIIAALSRPWMSPERLDAMRKLTGYAMLEPDASTGS
jgi:methyltransferase (TIGR00027 family)